MEPPRCRLCGNYHWSRGPCNVRFDRAAEAQGVDALPAGPVVRVPGRAAAGPKTAPIGAAALPARRKRWKQRWLRTRYNRYMKKYMREWRAKRRGRG